MIKIGLAISISVLILATGCAIDADATGGITTPSTPITPLTPIVMPTPTKSTMVQEDRQYVPNVYTISSGIGVMGDMTITYRVGATLDRESNGYEPFYIINRLGATTEKKTITTFKDETVADIPINQLLHAGDIKSVLTVTSNLSTDNLEVIGYVHESNSLTISGFTPEAERKATITYMPDTTFTIFFDSRKPLGDYEQAPEELLQYFHTESQSVVVAPDSYAPLNYSLVIPIGVKTPSKWVVFIVAETALPSGQGSIGAGMASTGAIRVTMKE